MDTPPLSSQSSLPAATPRRSKAEAQRIASRLKRGAAVVAMLGFSAFGVTIGSHLAATSATAATHTTTTSSTSSGTSSTSSTSSSGGYFSQSQGSSSFSGSSSSSSASSTPVTSTSAS